MMTPCSANGKVKVKIKRRIEKEKRRYDAVLKGGCSTESRCAVSRQKGILDTLRWVLEVLDESK